MNSALSSTLQPGNGYQLPPEAYYAQDWFEREQKALFPANWTFVCTLEDLKANGAYVCANIGYYPIVVIKDESGTVRAFHNMCRHRGARLLDDTGTCRKMSCPYHRWQYGLDGQLEHAPQASQQLPALVKEDWGLLPVALGIWMGMVFVNADGKAEPFEQWLDQIPAHLDIFKINELTELASVEYTFEANWKFYIENHIDWYHLWYTHARTLSMLNHETGRWQQLGRHWISYEPFKDPENRTEPFKPLDWLNEAAKENGAHFLYPNLTLFSGSSWFGIGHLIPITPEHTRMAFRLLALPEQDPTDFMAGFEYVTQVEDAEMAARLQANIRSPVFQVGPLTQTHEKPIAHFHDNYLQNIPV
ncbi:MAG: aromatic ring-hydroxylating dioxygenase subunit alpha [Pseudomonadota bacterium]